MSREAELGKKTAIITIGRISTQFVTFLLLPLYTTVLSTEEYGAVDLITTLVQLFIPIFSLMIDQGVFRNLLSCKDDVDRKRTISSAFIILSCMSALTIAIYFIVSIFTMNQYKSWLLLILIATAYSNFFLQVARGVGKTLDYAFGSLICSSATILFNVLCIVSLNMGARGMLIATFLGNFICCIFLFFKLRIFKYISIKLYSKEIALDELRYSVPLVPNQLSLWIMNSSDRLVVTFFMGTAANGILAISHKFPAIYMTFFSIFQLAWHEIGAVHYYDEDRDVFFSEMFDKVITLFSTMCMGIIAILPLVFDLFINKSYLEAYYNIPIYMVGFLFNIIIGLLGVVYVATKKTSEIAKTTIIAAVINLVVNVVLIKFIGLYAAAISTFIGYAVTMIYRIVDTRKYLEIKYNTKSYLGLSVIMIVYCIIYYVNNKVLSIVCLILFLPGACYFNRQILESFWIMAKEKLHAKE